MEQQQYYEIPSNFSPVYNMANILMRERGHGEICNYVADAHILVVNTDFDNWNGDAYSYTVYLNLPIKIYASLSVENIREVERILSETLNEVNSKDDSYFNVRITPILSGSDIDWNIIGGITARTELKQKIETIRNIMISVATGGKSIQEENDRYIKIHNEIILNCKKINLPYNNTYTTLWGWYGKWKADFPTYQERRTYINELFSQTLSYFEEENSLQNMETLVEITDWERIARTITKIKRDSNAAKNEEDFQAIGLLCRDVIISLAQTIYVPEVHGSTNEKGVEIGKTDAVAMIESYVKYKLDGSSNEELRAYVKGANKLANRLTHRRNASKKDMLLTMSSTIALINFIGIIEDKY